MKTIGCSGEFFQLLETETDVRRHVLFSASKVPKLQNSHPKTFQPVRLPSETDIMMRFIAIIISVLDEQPHSGYFLSCGL